MRKWTSDAASLVLRVAVGLIFIPHGWSKVFSPAGVAGFAHDLPSYHLPVFLGYAAAYSELACGFLLIAGVLTRIDGFLLSCTMFVAAFVVQMPDALNDPDNAGKAKFFAVMRGIELPLALFAASVALVLIGGGRWSLDYWWKVRGERRVVRGEEPTHHEP
jgi:putative oxidoreductase